MLDPKYAINQFRAGNNHALGNTADTQGSVVKYGQLPDSRKAHGLNIFSPAFAATIFKHAIGQSERQAGEVINTVLKIPKVLSLGTLLDPDSYRDNGGGDLGPANQSSADDAMKKKRKKKKRRGLGDVK